MKKQVQILLIILTIPVLGLCQDKFSAGANFSTMASKLVMVNSNAPDVGISEKGSYGIGYSFGIQAQYKLNEKLFLRTGMQYQNQRYRHQIDGMRFPTDIVNETESSIRNDIAVSSIGIPVDFGYRIRTGNEKISYLIGLGGVGNIALNTKTKAKVIHEQMDDEELKEAENQANQALISVGVFGGMEIELTDKLILGIEPNIRYAPNMFTLYLFDSEAETVLEAGLTLRIRMK